jgi:hypothetical protein
MIDVHYAEGRQNSQPSIPGFIPTSISLFNEYSRGRQIALHTLKTFPALLPA